MIPFEFRREECGTAKFELATHDSRQGGQVRGFDPKSFGIFVEACVDNGIHNVGVAVAQGCVSSIFADTFLKKIKDLELSVAVAFGHGDGVKDGRQGG